MSSQSEIWVGYILMRGGRGANNSSRQVVCVAETNFRSQRDLEWVEFNEEEKDKREKSRAQQPTPGIFLKHTPFGRMP